MNDEKLNTAFDDPEAVRGIITKTACIKAVEEITEADLKKINKYTIKPVKEEDVYVFKTVMADNEGDDRNYMPFDLKALQDLMKLYPGKTMLKDHRRFADNQIARVFDTDLVQNPNKTTDSGELHTELVGKCYMIRTDGNKDLIAEIDGGIKKEVSTSTRPNKMLCNICGTDNMKTYCRHWPGIEYTIEDGSGKCQKKRCKMLLSGAKEAFELSFVAVPAQPRAGTYKCAGFAKPVPEGQEDATEKNKRIMSKADAFIIRQRARRIASVFNTESEEK